MASVVQDKFELDEEMIHGKILEETGSRKPKIESDGELMKKPMSYIIQ